MSREQKGKHVTLHEPEQAVHSYLEALLKEVDDTPEDDIQVKTATVVDIRPAVVKALQQATVEIEKSADTSVQEAEQTTESRSEPEICIPDWAQQPFQTLFFKVRGMTLGIPLGALNSIAEWDQELTTMPGQPEWHMGILMHREQKVVVVDTAKLIMPERLGGAAEVKGSHILLIGDGRWGLACDSLKSPQMLDKESVRWRRGEGLQPWMAGTVIDHLSILLDVDALLKMIGHE